MAGVVWSHQITYDWIHMCVHPKVQDYSSKTFLPEEKRERLNIKLNIKLKNKMSDSIYV